MSEVTVQVERDELTGLAADLESHAATDPNEENLRAFMIWASEQLERLAGEAE